MGLRFINEKILLFNLYLFSLRVFVPWWPSSYIFYLKKSSWSSLQLQPNRESTPRKRSWQSCRFFLQSQQAFVAGHQHASAMHPFTARLKYRTCSPFPTATDEHRTSTLVNSTLKHGIRCVKRKSQNVWVEETHILG